MIKRISLLLVSIIFINLFSVSVFAQSDIQVKLDGEYLQFDVSPVSVNGRTLVPMRAIFEKLGYEITWNGQEQSVTGTRNGQTVYLFLGKTYAKIIDPDGSITDNPNMLDVPPTSVNGRTLVPLRFIAETAGASVEWDGEARTVIITTKDPELQKYREIIKDKAIFENDIRMFTLYAFMNFTGYDDENNQDGFSEVRKMVRDDLSKMNLKLSDNNYYKNKGLSYSLYRNALASIGTAPDFKSIGVNDSFLPDLGDKLKEFYSKANIEDLFKKYKPYYDKELSKYEDSSIEAIAKTNKNLRIDGSEIPKFYIQVNLLDAYERGSGLGLIEKYRNTGVITTGPSERPNIENIVHEYLHGIVNPVTESLKNTITSLDISSQGTAAAQGYREKVDIMSECIVRAVAAYGYYDKPEIQKSIVAKETQNGFTLTQYVYDKLEKYDSYKGTFKDFLKEIIEQY